MAELILSIVALAGLVSAAPQGLNLGGAARAAAGAGAGAGLGLPVNAASVPTSRITSISVTLPTISATTAIALPAGGPAPGLPSVEVPSVPAVALPSVTVPSVAAPGVPSAALPSVPAAGPPSLAAPGLPSAALPSLAAPGLPSAALPSAAVPSVPIALPATALPALPTAGLPAMPSAGLPAASLPGLPSVGVPSLPAGAPSLPAASLPAGASALPALLQASLPTGSVLPVDIKTMVPLSNPEIISALAILPANAGAASAIASALSAVPASGLPTLPEAPTGILPGGVPALTAAPDVNSILESVTSAALVKIMGAVASALAQAASAIGGGPSAALPSSVYDALQGLPTGQVTDVAGAAPTGLPAAPSGLPAAPPGLPAVPTGLPAAPSILPAVPSGLPTVPSGIPAVPTGLPAIPASLPAVPGGLPAVGTSLPVPSTGVPNVTLPGRTTEEEDESIDAEAAKEKRQLPGLGSITGGAASNPLSGVSGGAANPLAGVSGAGGSLTGGAGLGSAVGGLTANNALVGNVAVAVNSLAGGATPLEFLNPFLGSTGGVAGLSAVLAGTPIGGILNSPAGIPSMVLSTTKDIRIAAPLTLLTSGVKSAGTLPLTDLLAQVPVLGGLVRNAISTMNTFGLYNVDPFTQLIGLTNVAALQIAVQFINPKDLALASYILGSKDILSSNALGSMLSDPTQLVKAISAAGPVADNLPAVSSMLILGNLGAAGIQNLVPGMNISAVSALLAKFPVGSLPTLPSSSLGGALPVKE